MRLARLFVSPAGRWTRFFAGLLLTIAGVYLTPTHEPLGYLAAGVGLVPLVAAINDVCPLALVLDAGSYGDDLWAYSR